MSDKKNWKILGRIGVEGDTPVQVIFINLAST